MACHVVTALKTIKEHGEPRSSMKAAVELSCWTEDMDTDDWESLDNLVKKYETEEQFAPALYGWATALEPKYTNTWYGLGCPETREEWSKAKWNVKEGK